MCLKTRVWQGSGLVSEDIIFHKSKLETISWGICPWSLVLGYASF